MARKNPTVKFTTAGISVPVLTHAMIEAGLVQIISGQQTNGSYIAQVDLAKIQRDENINPRKPSPSHINDIVAQWNKDCFDSPKVNLKVGQDGKLYLVHINGQHSIGAALSNVVGLGVATCQVWFYKSDAECARIFHQAASNTKRMGTWTAYKSALLAGDVTALAISKAIGSAGFTSPDIAGSTADLVNYAPIFEAATRYNDYPGMLDRFLAVLSIFKDDNNQLTDVAAKGEFQRGLLDFVAWALINRELSISFIKERLDRKSARQYHTLATALANKATSRTNRGYFKQAFETALKGK